MRTAENLGERGTDPHADRRSAALCDHAVADTLEDPAEIDAELRHLQGIVGQARDW